MGKSKYKVISKERDCPIWGSGVWETGRNSLRAALSKAKAISENPHVISVQVVNAKSGRVWPITQQEGQADGD